MQLCAVLMLREGMLSGRRLAHFKSACTVFGMSPTRVPHMIREVETEGAVLFGTESKLPPEVLFRHLVRLIMADGIRHGAITTLLSYVAEALGVESQRKQILRTEKALLADVASRVGRARRKLEKR